jgi:hypothetical protein
MELATSNDFKMRRLYFILLLVTISCIAFGQNERKHVRSGNRLFMEAVRDTTKIDSLKFSEAETEYLKALEKRPDDLQWQFNMADALYKQQRFEEAEQKFTELTEKMEEPIKRSRANHNLGNTQLMQQKLDESIESYKKALRDNPSDLETKYNLAYAQMLKDQKEKQEQQQQQNQDQNQDQDKDQNKDQDQDQDKDNQDKNKDQNKDQQNQDQNQNKDQQNKDQQQQQQPQNKISKKDAEQLLKALQNDERDIQDKVKKEKAAKAKRSKSEKEWY